MAIHTMSAKFITATALYLISLCAISRDFDPDDVIKSQTREAIILLNVNGIDSNNVKKSSFGTAFFISPDGFAITAAHLFYTGSDPSVSAERMKKAPETSFVTGQIGSAGVGAVHFELVRLYDDYDLALIKQFDILKPAQYLKVCDSEPPAQDTLYAFGYMRGSGLIYPSGKRLGGLNRNRYLTGISINEGLSGGPIIGTGGNAVGMSISGIRENNIQGMNFYLPLQFASNLIQDAKVKFDCSIGATVGIPKPVESLTVGSRTVLLDGFRDFSSSSFDFSKAQIVNWGSLAGDIGVANARSVEPRDSEVSFFLPFNASPYMDARDARSGIARAPVQNLINADDCSALNEMAYTYHWFKPSLHTTYCVRLRDGRSLSKITIQNITSDRLYFDWIYKASP